MVDKKDGVLDLRAIGQKTLRNIHRNLPTPLLYEEIINNREGQISFGGPVVVRTGDYTERPLTDKFIVREAVSEQEVSWSYENEGMSEQQFNGLLYRLLAYMQNKEVYVQYCYAGRDPDYRISLRFVSETAWHSLFCRNMFAPVNDVKDFDKFEPDFSVVHIPAFHAMPDVDGVNSSAFVVFNIGQKVVCICGTSYAGEIRQAVFTIVNYLLSKAPVFSMRCSANVGPEGDAAIFMGRGGAGKTTLSVDPERKLVGDHVHGWSDKGLFNFEWGSYARVFNISWEDEPEIYECTRKFGSILENVSVDLETRRIDLGDGSLTENTRVAYPLTHLPNVVGEGVCGHPRNIFLLTCDALGVMPPIARLSPEMAVYAFLSGYTSKFTETGSGPAEPDVQFNTCFGASSLTLPAHLYGKQLMERIKKHNIACWLINTGWSGEPRGNVDRIKIAHSRALVKAALSGKLENVAYETDPVFSFEIPKECPGVPSEILNPRSIARDPGEYELRAIQLAKEFMKDFAQFEDEMPDTMRTMLSDVLTLDDSFDIMEELSISM